MEINVYSFLQLLQDLKFELKVIQTYISAIESNYCFFTNKSFCVVSFLKGPNTIYSVRLVLGYQYIVSG